MDQKGGKERGRPVSAYHLNEIRRTRGGRSGAHIQITYWVSSMSALSLGTTPDIHEIESAQLDC